MLADQVVQPVPALGRLGNQVLVVQGLQAAAGGTHVRAVQGGGGVAVDVGAGVQPEPPEQPLLVPGEVGIGQVERGGHRQVLGGHQLQPVHGRGQLDGPPGRGPGRVMVQLAGHHPDRQRQVPAQPGELGHRRIVRAQPGPARQADQQRRGLAGRQGVETDRRGVLQRGQVAAAGDQHQAAAGAGQQRADLLAAGRIIEHQQQLLTGQPVPPQRHPCFQAGRDLRGGNPGGQQQAGQRVGRVDRLLPGRVPVQREEDLPAGEPVREPVRGVHRERGLADPGHPADRVDAHHTARTRRGLRQLLEFLLAPGERGDITRQRPGGRRSGARSSVPRVAGPRDRLEPRSGRADQVQRIGQQPSSILVCPPADPPLQVTDRPRAQACRLRQLLLRQPRRHAQLSQQPAEIKRRLVGHGPPSPQTLRPRCQARRSTERPAPSVRGARNLDHRLAQFSQPQTGSHPVPRAGRQASLSWAGLALTQSTSPQNCGSICESFLVATSPAVT